MKRQKKEHKWTHQTKQTLYTFSFEYVDQLTLILSIVSNENKEKISKIKSRLVIKFHKYLNKFSIIIYRKSFYIFQSPPLVKYENNTYLY